MCKFKSDNVLPLRNADHRFLEVLINHFSLSKSEKGFCLDVKFDYRNCAIWSDLGKRHIKEKIHNFEKKSNIYQEKLDDFLLRGKGRTYHFSDKDFLFRYASGGTLPIIRRGRNEYYSFFYRDIDPIGWNIANGGCDSLHELLNPNETIDRELREELVAFNRKRKEWLLFEAGEGVELDRPGLIAVRKIISKQFPHLNLGSFKTTEIPLKWLDGPDELNVTFEKESRSQVRKCFLNINAEDFGIEIDRIAWITIDPETICFDGESWDEIVVNSPVCLFEVERFNNLVASGCKEFLPDVFFYDAQLYENGSQQIQKAIELYIQRISKKRPYHMIQAYRNTPLKFDMCPATRRIVQRYISTLVETKRGAYDIFISFASEDKRYAQRIYEYLARKSNKRIFFSDAILQDGNFSRQIDQALESAELLILVGTSTNKILKPFVEFEWRTFHLLSLTERKKRNLIPVMIGVDPQEMPLLLRLYQGHFLKNSHQLQSCLLKLDL